MFGLAPLSGQPIASLPEASLGGLGCLAGEASSSATAETYGIALALYSGAAAKEAAFSPTGLAIGGTLATIGGAILAVMLLPQIAAGLSLVRRR